MLRRSFAAEPVRFLHLPTPLTRARKFEAGDLSSGKRDHDLLRFWTDEPRPVQ